MRSLRLAVAGGQVWQLAVRCGARFWRLETGKCGSLPYVVERGQGDWRRASSATCPTVGGRPISATLLLPVR